MHSKTPSGPVMPPATTADQKMIITAVTTQKPNKGKEGKVRTISEAEIVKRGWERQLIQASEKKSLLITLAKTILKPEKCNLCSGLKQNIYISSTSPYVL